MALVDKLFIDMCEDILAHGTSTEREIVRPKWEDGTPAYTIKKFGVVNRYDLTQEFPLLTLRPVSLKLCVDEILWIYQKKSNKISELKSHIWDQWAGEDGTIGEAYGYQIGKKYLTHTNGGKSLTNIDQMDDLLQTLKKTPFSRRMLTNMYNHDDLYKMNLHPCAYGVTWNVTDNGYDKLVLNTIVNQRSHDILVANGWNVAQYAALQMMVAQAVDMIPGEMVHVIADAHIYDRHIDIIKDLIWRSTYAAATVKLDPDIKDFYQFTPESFIVENYKHNEQIKNIPVAV